MEGKKIKQIGMQHTTTDGWNKGGVKLGQLGVSVAGERVGSILSLSLVFSSTARTRERARRHASAYMHARFSPRRCLPIFLIFLPASFIGRLRAAAHGKSRNARQDKALDARAEEKEGGFRSPARRADGSLQSRFSRSRELLNCGIRIIMLDRNNVRYNNPVSCYLYYYVQRQNCFEPCTIPGFAGTRSFSAKVSFTRDHYTECAGTKARLNNLIEER